MGILSKKKEKKEIALVFDIGSFSVGGALFEVSNSNFPKILFSVRDQIKIEKDISTERFFKLTLKSLDLVASKILKNSLIKPDRIFCVLSSSWYVSSARTIKLEKNTPFIFTKKIADDLLKKELTLFKEEYIDNFSNTENEIQIIEFKNTKTMLNGYNTSMPFDKKTKKIEMELFISMSGKKILSKIESIIAKHFNFRDIIFSSFALSSFTVVRDMFTKQENFLLIDIGGEVTDISMIKKDVLGHSISYPLGCNFIIRRISSVLNCSIEEARSLFFLYNNNHLLNSFNNKLEKTIKRVSNEWLDRFQESLSNISNDISIPSNIFLTVDKDFADFFSKIIKSEQFNQYTFTNSRFKIFLLNTETLHGTAFFSKDIERDPFLIVEAVYLNRFIC